MKATGFKNLKKPLSAEKRAAQQAERQALALYEEQLIRMCWKKIGYTDEKRAARAIVKIHTRDSAATIRAYKCPACVFWHLTSAAKA